MEIKGLYEKRGWWYYQPATGEDGVRPKAIALRTQDSEAAVRLAFDERERMQLVTAAVSGRMSQAITEYLRDRAAERKHTAKTAYNTERSLRQICADLKNPKITDLTPEKLKTWGTDLCGRASRVAIRGSDSKVKKRKNTRLSDATIAAYSRVFRAFVTWAYKKGKLLRNPADSLPSGRSKATRKIRACTFAQRDKLVDQAPTPELAFILHLGLFAGLRFGEILAMEPAWMWFNDDKTQGTINVQETKHWKPKDKEARSIKMAPRLLAFLREWPIKGEFVLRPQKSKFPKPPKYRYNPEISFGKHVAKCGVPWLPYHDMRHSFGAHLAQRGATMVKIAEVLGDDVSVVERHFVTFLPDGDDAISLLG